MHLSTNDDFDVINTMMKQDSSIYLTESRLYDQSTDIDGDCRKLMVDWCAQVSDFCKFDRSTICIAINILDRFMAKERHILNENNGQFQLAAIACFYTAVKTNEPVALDPETVSRLSKRQFSAKQIEEMEFKIMRTIDWRVNVPTALAFAAMFLKTLPSDLASKRQQNCIIKLVEYQVIYATKDSKFIGIPASELAFTAVYNATMMMNIGSLACEKANNPLRHSTNLSRLPIKLENELLLQAENSGILADFIPVAPTQKLERRKSSPKNLEKDNLSPRCVTMSR